MKIVGNFWVVVNEENGSLVYAVGSNRAEAYYNAGTVLGDEASPLTTMEIKAMGYKARKVSELTFVEGLRK